MTFTSFDIKQLSVVPKLVKIYFCVISKTVHFSTFDTSEEILVIKGLPSFDAENEKGVEKTKQLNETKRKAQSTLQNIIATIIGNIQK